MSDINKHGEEDLTADDYLVLHRITGLPLRILWLVFQRTRGAAPRKRPTGAAG